MTSAIALVAAAAGGIVHADSIAIQNAGFEDPVIADGDYIYPGGPNWAGGSYNVANPTTWIPGNDDTGLWNPDAVDGFTTGAFAGENTGWAISRTGIDAGLSQVLPDTLQADTQYILAVQVGNAFYNLSDATAPYRLELLAGGVLLQSATGASPAADTWEFHSLTYNSGANPAQLGQQLEIRLIAVDYTDAYEVDGYEVDFDEVSLTATLAAPPELTVTKDGTELLFKWNSQAGMRYNLKSSADLTADFPTWTLVEGDIPADLPANTKSIPRPADPTLFYIVEAFPASPGP